MAPATAFPRNGPRGERKGGRPLYEEKSNRLLLPSYFRVHEDRVEAFFWPFKYEIPVSEVERVELVMGIPWYVGWGLRINPWKRTLYFAIHHGKCLKIRKRGGFWKNVVISVRDSEKVFSIFNKVLRRSGRDPS
jgi:hypothetical protein